MWEKLLPWIRGSNYQERIKKQFLDSAVDDTLKYEYSVSNFRNEVTALNLTLLIKYRL